MLSPWAARAQDIRDHNGEDIKAKVATCPFWAAKERGKQGQQIIKGSGPPAVAFLITILPNLQEMQFAVPTAHSHR